MYIPPVFAQDINYGQSKINPSSPLYFLKATREVLELKLAGTTHIKALRQFEFSIRRIREVNSLAGSPRQDLIEPTLVRYLFHLGEYLNILNLKDAFIAEQAVTQVSRQMNVLQTIYYQVSDPRAQMAIRTTVYRLTQHDQALIKRFNELLIPNQIMDTKIAGCQFLSREASVSALNEVERTVLSERAQKCQNP